MHRPFLLLGLATVGALVPLAVRGPDPTVQGGDRYCFAQGDDISVIDNAPYDGRFTFFRVRFETMFGGGRGFRGRVDQKWDHDAPLAERNLMKILVEITNVRPKMDCHVIYPFGDPESFKYPMAYVSEPGFWTMDETELKGIRDFVTKGGFVIFDDFTGPHWYNFEEKWRQAFPELQLQQLDRSHRILDTFYDIRASTLFRPHNACEWYGAFKDNDPTKRLVAIANHDCDVGDMIEFSDRGFIPIDISNEAYKVMVNYVIYAMTY